MDRKTAFKEFRRKGPLKRPVAERVRDYNEVYLPLPHSELRIQAARCMNCGVPFCHVGCPLGNLIPDWNNLVYQEQWQAAYYALCETNNFPEFTGRLCPAPCEESCVLSITDPAVTIEHIERSIIEHAFENGWVLAQTPAQRSGKRIAIVGSGPAGLAAADQLNRAGHFVTVFERDDRIGGLLRYGIPDFKMEKQLIDRRLKIMMEEGVIFQVNAGIGETLPVRVLDEYDAAVLCTGATAPRDLQLEGRESNGIHYAMDYLIQQNRECAGLPRLPGAAEQIHAGGKHVVVIGGGDTASDCIGTANRQGALSIVNFDYHDIPPEDRPLNQPWPYWPMRLRTSTSHEEGCLREWSVLTQRFKDAQGNVKGIETVRVELVYSEGQRRPRILEVPGSTQFWPADLVLIAIGYAGVKREGLVNHLGISLDERGNVLTDDRFMSSKTGVFAAGDMNRGQSLIVWAIYEGREVAREVDLYLMGDTNLPSRGSAMEFVQN